MEVPRGSNSHTPQAQTSQTSVSFLAAVLTTLIVLRLVNTLTIQTYFQPDEYFQVQEPAWQIAFGPDSGAWITWEWREALRSSIHPMFFAAVYRTAAQLSDLLQVTTSTRAEILIAAPKVAQAVIAAIGDFFTWRLASKLYGARHSAPYAALALTVFSPWQWYCSVRTFSNSLETTLTIAGLYYWPWHWFLQHDVTVAPRHKPAVPQGEADLDSGQMVKQFKNFLEHGDSATPNATLSGATGKVASVLPASAPAGLVVALLCAAAACVLRPTNLIIWATIGLCMLSRYGNLRKARVLTLSVAGCGSLILTAAFGADVAFYEAYVFPPLQFLYFNVLQGVAGFYGRNRIDYYFDEGLALLLTTAWPFAAFGLYSSLRPGMDKPSFRGYEGRQSRYVLAIAVVATVLAMTMISHKEVRFIYPLLPILHVLAAKPAAAFFSSVPANKVRLGLLLLMLTVNVYIAAYVSLVHQRGVIDVMHYLRHEQEARFLADPAGSGIMSNVTVGFLMPCHSTPWRSHFVYPEIKAWALTCEPPLNLSVGERRSYEDEADVFYAHPGGWIVANMKDRKVVDHQGTSEQVARAGDDERRDWPEYLAFFQHLEPVVSGILDGTRYEECWRGFNTHWHDDGRRRGDVVVWCMRL